MSGWLAAIVTARRRTAGSGSPNAARRRSSVEHAEALQRAERGRPHVAGGRSEPGLGRRHVAGVTGEGDGAPIDHFLSRSVNVTTIHARPKPVTVAKTAPITTARPPLATTAHTRRSGPAAW